MLSGKFMKPGRCPDVDWCSSSLFPFYEWFESIFLFWFSLFNINNMKPGRCPDVDWWLYTYTYNPHVYICMSPTSVSTISFLLFWFVLSGIVCAQFVKAGTKFWSLFESIYWTAIHLHALAIVKLVLRELLGPLHATYIGHSNISFAQRVLCLLVVSETITPGSVWNFDVMCAFEISHWFFFVIRLVSQIQI